MAYQSGQYAKGGGILAGTASFNAAGLSRIFAALGCNFGCQEPRSNELQVLDLCNQRHFARLAVEMSGEFNFSAAKF